MEGNYYNMNNINHIGRVFFFSGIKRKKEEKYLEIQNQENNLLCRFVFDGLGIKLGESIAIDEDIIIIKNGKKYLGIPLKHVEENDNKLIVKGLVDKKKALEMGEKWCQDSLKTICKK
jgi:hypothetical protein